MWDAIALALLIAGHNREATLVFGSAVLKYKRQFSTRVGGLGSWGAGEQGR
jgi:hypothetical protein